MPVQDCSLQNAWSLSGCERSRGWNVFWLLFFPNSSKLHRWKILGKFFPTASGSKIPFYFVLPHITSSTMAIPSLSTFKLSLLSKHIWPMRSVFWSRFTESGRVIIGIAVLGTRSQPPTPPAKGRACFPQSLPGGIVCSNWCPSLFSCLYVARVLKYSCCQYNQGRIPVSHGFPVSGLPSKEKYSIKTILSLPWKGHLQQQSDQGGKEVCGRTKSSALKAKQF